jgi:hypothetical protein
MYNGVPTICAAPVTTVLSVAMDEAFLVGMLDSLADRPEQLQPLPDRQAVLIAVIGDGHAAEQFHDEIRPARGGFAGIEHLGDVGMVHEGQRLALCFEPANDLAAVHARLENLDGHLAADRLLLLGQKDQAEAALAELFRQLVRTQDRARALARRDRRGNSGCQWLQEGASLVVDAQERVEPAAQFRMA